VSYLAQASLHWNIQRRPCRGPYDAVDVEAVPPLKGAYSLLYCLIKEIFLTSLHLHIEIACNPKSGP
jgi:hypothetical protein